MSEAQSGLAIAVQDSRHPARRTRRGTTVGEVVLVIIIAIVVLVFIIGMFLPGIGNGGSSRVTESMTNLRNFGAAMESYQAEWEGRQWTVTPDDFDSTLANGGGYQDSYSNDPDSPFSNVPSVSLGFDRDGRMVFTRRAWAIQPMFVRSNAALGNFRFFHSSAFNSYLNGKVYDDLFWAPKDYTVPEAVFAWIEDPSEWPSDADRMYPSTYTISPAGQFDPEVLSGERGSVADPATVPHGFRSPTYAQCGYPDLKTHMLEHTWLQNNPCDFMPGTETPWAFNLGQESAPATLFYDGHIRLMQVGEAVESNTKVVKQGSSPLWLSDAPHFGDRGYFEDLSYEGEAVSSYHIFTTNGILGRDTTLGG